MYLVGLRGRFGVWIALNLHLLWIAGALAVWYIRIPGLPFIVALLLLAASFHASKLVIQRRNEIQFTGDLARNQAFPPNVSTENLVLVYHLVSGIVIGIPVWILVYLIHVAPELVEDIGLRRFLSYLGFYCLHFLALHGAIHCLVFKYMKREMG